MGVDVAVGVSVLATLVAADIADAAVAKEQASLIIEARALVMVATDVALSSFCMDNPIDLVAFKVSLTAANVTSFVDSGNDPAAAVQCLAMMFPHFPTS